MDALFDAEEAMLDDAIRRQVAAHRPASVRGVEQFDDRPVWKSLADAGLLGLGVPEAAGGAGSCVDLTILARALGRSVAPVPYLGSAVLAAHLLALAGASSALVGSIIAGSRRIAVGLDAGLRRIAVIDDPAVMAWDSAGAEAAIVIDSDGSLIAIALSGPVTSFDLTRQVRPGNAQDRVALGDLGGPVSAEHIRAWTNLALVALAADQLGVMEGAMQLAVAHASTRVQFGVPIGSFQAVQHLLADAHVHAEAARGLVNYAAWAIDNEPRNEATRAALVANAYCSEFGRSAVEAVVQVHGGLGMTWESFVHVYQRRAVTNRVLFGDESVHHHALADVGTG